MTTGQDLIDRLRRWYPDLTDDDIIIAALEELLAFHVKADRAEAEADD